jgi:hypothetical protein
MSRARLQVGIVVLATALGGGWVAAAGCQGGTLGGGVPDAAGRGGSGAGSPLTGLGGGGAGVGVGGFTGTECGRYEQRATPVAPDFLMLLDASGSMDEDVNNAVCSGGCGLTSKWAQATAAIQVVTAETEATTRWGLKMFADGGGASRCAVSGTVAVPVGPGNAAAIGEAIAARTTASGGVSNGSSTPTRLALEAGTRYLTELTDISRKFILLVTDGLPNCMPGNVDSAADDSTGAVQAVESARAAGFPTFVVGVATSAGAADATLNALALAGGYPRPGTPSYYPVSSAGELVETLRGLVGTTGCLFSIPTPPADSSAYRFHVVAGGTALPRDHTHTSGWDFVDSTQATVEVFGPACADFKAGRIETISIIFLCDTLAF